MNRRDLLRHTGTALIAAALPLPVLAAPTAPAVEAVAPVLRVFNDNWGTTTIVGTTLDEALATYAKQWGMSLEEARNDCDWEEVPLDKPIAIHFEDEGFHEGLVGMASKRTQYGFEYELTAAEWTRINGPGFLCSTEW